MEWGKGSSALAEKRQLPTITLQLVDTKIHLDHIGFPYLFSPHYSLSPLVVFSKPTKHWVPSQCQWCQVLGKQSWNMWPSVAHCLAGETVMIQCDLWTVLDIGIECNEIQPSAVWGWDKRDTAEWGMLLKVHVCKMTLKRWIRIMQPKMMRKYSCIV